MAQAGKCQLSSESDVSVSSAELPSGTYSSTSGTYSSTSGTYSSTSGTYSSTSEYESSGSSTTMDEPHGNFSRSKPNSQQPNDESAEDSSSSRSPRTSLEMEVDTSLEMEVDTDPQSDPGRSLTLPPPLETPFTTIKGDYNQMIVFNKLYENQANNYDDKMKRPIMKFQDFYNTPAEAIAPKSKIESQEYLEFEASLDGDVCKDQTNEADQRRSVDTEACLPSHGMFETAADTLIPPSRPPSSFGYRYPPSLSDGDKLFHTHKGAGVGSVGNRLIVTNMSLYDRFNLNEINGVHQISFKKVLCWLLISLCIIVSIVVCGVNIYELTTTWSSTCCSTPQADGHNLSSTLGKNRSFSVNPRPNMSVSTTPRSVAMKYFVCRPAKMPEVFEKDGIPNPTTLLTLQLCMAEKRQTIGWTLVWIVLGLTAIVIIVTKIFFKGLRKL